jgi:transcriptional regulator with XRE-family HTH domain
MSTLRSLRERKGLTVSQLAGKASIPSRVITDYEEGRLTITLAHAKVLAKALWVGIEDLMPPAGAIPPPPVQSTPSQTAPPPAPRQAPSSPAPGPAQPPVSQPQRPATDAGGGQGYRQERLDHLGAQGARADVSRPPRPAGYEGREAGQGGQPGQGQPRGAGDSAGGGRPARGPRPAPPPPSAISEGQVQELERLASKLEIATEQLEERIGRKISELNRPEAKEWIKRVRGMAEELAPSKKAAYGQWPGGHVDQEASYLAEQKEAGAYFRFKLFNGEEIGGVITDFTPYTITVGSNGVSGDTVLRKLAIAYYRRGDEQAMAGTEAESVEPVAAASKATPKRTRAAKAQAAAPAHDHALDDHHQPLDKGIDSDRPDEPVVPESDSMDEDRGI